MDREVQEIRLEQWKKLIQDACSSDKTKKEWCQEHGFSEKRFYYWQRKVRRHALEKLPSEKADDRPQFAALSMPAKEASYTKELSSGSAAPEQTGSGLIPSVILLSGDCRILIGDAVSETLLTPVLRAVRNA